MFRCETASYRRVAAVPEEWSAVLLRSVSFSRKTESQTGANAFDHPPPVWPLTLSGLDPGGGSYLPQRKRNAGENRAGRQPAIGGFLTTPDIGQLESIPYKDFS